MSDLDPSPHAHDQGEFVPIEGDGFESPVKTWRDFWYLRAGGCLSVLAAGAVMYQTKSFLYGLAVFAAITFPLSVGYFRVAGAKRPE